jgi:hypothetical protein
LPARFCRAGVSQGVGYLPVEQVNGVGGEVDPVDLAIARLADFVALSPFSWPNGLGR